MTRWSRFLSLGVARLAGRVSLRDVVSNLKAQAGKLYHLGCAEVNRTTLARVNKQQPASLYEALFGTLLARCQGLSPKHRFHFKNKLYSLDALTCACRFSSGRTSTPPMMLKAARQAGPRRLPTGLPDNHRRPGA